ncbi:FRG domain-containing protein [Winogradskyella ouciana]|uniref:FRG domain-containing protein n=1 Tax=Winogradskyella ouciana TaxID=2608631 RepID=UPI003D2C8765
MGRTKEIDKGKVEDGIIEITLTHWKHFPKLITRDLLNFPSYIFRGQSRYNWKLESSFDRLSKSKKIKNPNLSQHLNAFKNASKGRRGKNPQELKSDNEWWALAQHYGLVTPLLDFTRSAFVALYFAFWDESDNGKNRVVYALHGHNLQKKMDELEEEDEKVELFYPSSDGNERLISQSGLFMKLPVNSNFEQIIKTNFKNYNRAILIKIKIPNTDVKDCLIMLNRMNINHSTLFPDLYGAAKFVNCLFDKPRYDYIGNLNITIPE